MWDSTIPGDGLVDLVRLLQCFAGKHRQRELKIPSNMLVLRSVVCRLRSPGSGLIVHFRCYDLYLLGIPYFEASLRLGE